MHNTSALEARLGICCFWLPGEAVRGMLIRYPAALSQDYAQLNGMTLTPDTRRDWYWLSNNKKINYVMQWGPGEPHLQRPNEFCLGIGPKSDPKFIDVDCSGDSKHSFMCEKKDFYEN
jgi:hypothetical protein